MVKIDGVIREETPEEITQREAEAKRFEAQERQRPLSEQEIITLFIRQNIQTLSVDDQTSVRMLAYYPEWADAITYEEGFKVQRGGKLYKCRQWHNSQPNWAPDRPGTESLWTVINEQYSGDQYDPIPYSGNMVLEKGKYYTQDGVMYKCTRPTGDPVSHNLSDLVGIYVTKEE